MTQENEWDNYRLNRSPSKRENEQFRENLRQAMTRDVWDTARLLDSKVVMRHVDEDVVTKCRLSIYDKQSDALRRTARYDVQEAQMEMDRDASVESARLQDRLDPREIPLHVSLERLYFDTFGESSNGDPVPDKPNGGYTCPCGLKMMMSWKLMRLHCPKCNRLTPAGKLKESGALRR